MEEAVGKVRQMPNLMHIGAGVVVEGNGHEGCVVHNAIVDGSVGRKKCVRCDWHWVESGVR